MISRRSIIKTVMACVLPVFSSWFFPALSGGGPAIEPETFSGKLSAGYRLRHDSEERDTLHQFFQRADMAWTPFSNDSRLVFSGDLYENPGGNDDRPETAFASYGSVHGFVNEAYAEVKNVFSFMNVKAGRQFVSRELSVQLDGLDVVFRLPGGKSSVYLFGGYTADPYGDESWDSGRAAGAGLSCGVSEWIRAGAEFLMTTEDPEDAEKETFKQGALSLTWTFDSGAAGIKASSLDSDIESVRVHSTLHEILGPDSEAMIAYTFQFKETERMPTASSPFTRLLGPLKPYHQVNALLYKGFTDTGVAVSGGGEFRALTKNEDDSEYNHSYVHGFLSIEKSGLFGKDLRFDLHADFWQNSGAGSDGKTVSTGGDRKSVV
jgi:hypothetical protein